ncbi:MAG: pyridoxal phosphate-dependent aminotransferase [Thermoanaerobaculia bacterium]
MKARNPARPGIAALESYSLVPELALPVRAKLDFNESPFDVPDDVKEKVFARLKARRWSLYPEFGSGRLRNAIAASLERRPEEIVVGNGSGEILLAAINVFAGGGRLLLTPPTFSLYPQLAAIAQADVVAIPLLGDGFAFDEAAVLRSVEESPRTIPLLCSPNNPTGTAADVGFLRRLAAAAPVLLVDQAYVDFAPDEASAFPLVDEGRDAVVFRTLSKAFAAAGFRIGYAVARPELAREVTKAILPFSVDQAAEELAVALLENPAPARARVLEIVRERERVAGALIRMGAKVAPAAGNFLFVEPPGGEPSRVRKELLALGILVRDLGPSAPRRIRVTIGRREENDLFLEELGQIVRRKEEP